MDGVVEIPSILESVKKNLGSSQEYEAFDHDIVLGINNAFSILYDEGLNLDGEPIEITGPDETWDDVIDNEKIIAKVKEFVFLKTKLLFDPPNNSFLLSHYENLLKELEWRIYTEVNEYLPEDVY